MPDSRAIASRVSAVEYDTGGIRDADSQTAVVSYCNLHEIDGLQLASRLDANPTF